MPASPDEEARLAAARRRIDQVPMAVLRGGVTGERDVSLRSGAAVLAALGETRGRQAARLIDVEIDEAGTFLVDGRRGSAEDALAAVPRDALWFLALHGGAGEDGRVQAWLELAGRPYTGSGPAASALCMDKRVARLVCAEAGLVIAPAAFVQAGVPRPSRLAALGDGPLYVKPNHGGSSVLTFRVDGRGRELDQAIEAVLTSGDDVLVEQGVVGLEATCGVLGSRGGRLRTLPVVEIEPRAGRFFDYEEKYQQQGARETCPPVQLSPAVIESIERAARAAFTALGCEGYARIDFLVRESDQTPVFLEANTLPGMTPRSLLPLAASVAGLSFEALCVELSVRALAHWTERA